MPEGYPIIDGFLFDTRLKPDLTWRAMALKEYTDVRRAGGYRSRAWCIPLSSQISIPANDSFEFQVDWVPGSVFTLWSFYVSQRVLTSGGNFSVRIKEACNDSELTTEPVFSAWGTPNATQRRMPRPLVVGLPGTLNVEICSTYSLPSQPGDCQLILWGQEPV